MAQELAPILTRIFNQSLSCSTVPTSWTEAFTAPVFKKGAWCMPENYRPISLTCDRKIQVDMAILDFSKAFDTVPRDHLLVKMEFYGIQGPLLKWTASFLTTRSQSVLVEGKYSKPGKVLSGVSQGTVLGPLLFLIHINDLHSVVTSQVRLFVDDCLMHCPVQSLADQLALQAYLLALERWGDAWGTHFNAGKCQIMQVYRGQGLVHFYTLCGQVLSVVEELKYLIFDDLSWSPHISSITGKAASTLGFLRRNLRKCPAQLKERAYIASVRSTLDFVSLVWDPFLKRDINNLEKIHRRAARFITGVYHPIPSVSSMLRPLGWPDLKDRRCDTRLALLFKTVNGDVAVAVDDLHLKPADRRTRSNHRHKYKHKGASTPELQNFFIIAHAPPGHQYV